MNTSGRSHPEVDTDHKRKHDGLIGVRCVIEPFCGLNQFRWHYYARQLYHCEVHKSLDATLRL